MKVEQVLLRTEFNYDRDAATVEHGFDCSIGGPSMAHQSFMEECDINTIVERFGITGQLPSNVRMPTYGDFTGVGDYKTAMNAIVAARESFDQMPAKVRKRFHDDPAEFVDFCSDQANMEEARKLGLVPEKELEAAASLAAPAPPREPVAPAVAAPGTVVT